MIITVQDGELRCILGDEVDVPDLVQSIGTMPARASSIELVGAGRFAGHWYVDFSLLAGQTGDSSFNCCLVKCFRNRSEAIQAEVQWLKKNFLGVEDDC